MCVCVVVFSGGVGRGVVSVLILFLGGGESAMIVSGLLDFEIIYIANELVQQKINVVS